MLRFNEFLTEGTSDSKTTHLTHLEDVVIDEGPTGVKFALAVLRDFGKMLDGGSVSKALNIHTKIDGAPSLVFGPDPADGRFFVATKSAFAKTPKLAKTHADIDAMYQSGVSAVLHAALDELPDLAPKQVLQGDVLFAPGTVSTQTLDGKTYYTFQPNTLMYAVEIDSDMGARVASANFGIAIHTMYSGRGSVANLQTAPISASVFASLKRSSSVMVYDNTYPDVSGTATFTSQERADFAFAWEAASAASRGVPAQLYSLVQVDPLHALLAQFINAQVRQNVQASPAQAAADFLSFLEDKVESEIDSKKSEGGKASARAKYQPMMDAVYKNKKGFIALFGLHQAIANAKEIVIDKMATVQNMATFVRDGDGYRVTGPEGYVAVARNGKTVKLVDRLEFSRLNFTVPKTWK
jgi:hypothetical protein